MKWVAALVLLAGCEALVDFEGKSFTLGAAGSGASGGAGGGGGVVCDPALDDFRNAATFGACWEQLHGDLATTFEIDESSGGTLLIVPQADSGWWSDEPGHGPYLYRDVTGNFLVATYAHALNAAETGGPTSVQYNMAGLVVHRPTEPPREWIKWEVGHRVFGLMGSEDTPYGTLAAYQSSTQAATHVLNDTNYNDEDVHYAGLAICRIGEDFGLYYRVETGDWIPVHTLAAGVNGPSLPQEVQVGITAGAFSPGTADLHARFDYLWFSPTEPETGVDCETLLETEAPEPIP